MNIEHASRFTVPTTSPAEQIVFTQFGGLKHIALIDIDIFPLALLKGGDNNSLFPCYEDWPHL